MVMLGLPDIAAELVADTADCAVVDNIGFGRAVDTVGTEAADSVDYA